MKAGRFITLEGGEGVGKSTQLQAIVDTLHRLNIETCVTREPGGTPMAEQIRELILGQASEQVHRLSETLMMFAARNQHIQEVIHPALAAGKWVVCDRFVDATYAYQGGARGESTELIAQLEHWVCGELHPDLTLLLDVAPDVGMQRIADRTKDRMEQEAQSFYHAVRQTYLDRAAAEPQRFAVVDANRSLAEVTAVVTQVIEAFVTKSQGNQ